jgi:arabinofuranosyltransferase
MALVVGIRTAWVSDDAWIVFRVVEHLWSGHGLRYNIDERTCVFTSPLMMLVLAASRGVTSNLAAASMAVGLLCWTAAVYTINAPLARDAKSAFVGGAVMLCSKAATDYATSGLENALGYLVVAWLIVLARSGAPPLRVVLIATILSLVRLDLALLSAPVAIWGFVGANRNGRSRALWGLTPLIVWEVCSLVYFGTLTPNPALAKLGAGIPIGMRLDSGVSYFVHSLVADPITLTTVAVGIVFGFVTPGVTRPLAIGLTAYLVYVLAIGGDFMSGRFFAVPLVAAVATIHIALNDWTSTVSARVYLFAGAAAACSLLHPSNPVFANSTYKAEPGSFLTEWHGIADERAIYYPHTGLLNTWSREPASPGGAGGPTLEVELVSAAGFSGYTSADNVIIVDWYAIVDPLRARLPARADRPQRVGHYTRFLPPGYLESRSDGEPRLEDPALAELFVHLRHVHSGPLFTRERWLDIWRLNTGALDDLVQPDHYRLPATEDAIDAAIEAAAQSRLRPVPPPQGPKHLPRQ